MEIRCIIDGKGNAAYNMAKDLYLLEKCISDNIFYLRFYEWEKPCITIGYNQNPCRELCLENLKRDGVDWIRRPTGGRAVLHWNDITYSCIFPESFKEMGTTIAQTYDTISDALLRGLEFAGIIADKHQSDLDPSLAKSGVQLPCFLAPNRNEIMIDHKKLIGSAQKRNGKAVLQHGSIPMSPDYRKLPGYLNIDEQQKNDQTASLEKKTTCLSELLKSYDIRFMINAFINGFTFVLDSSIQGIFLDQSCESEIRQVSQSASFTEKWCAV